MHLLDDVRLIESVILTLPGTHRLHTCVGGAQDLCIYVSVDREDDDHHTVCPLKGGSIIGHAPSKVFSLE